MLCCDVLYVLYVLACAWWHFLSVPGCCFVLHARPRVSLPSPAQCVVSLTVRPTVQQACAISSLRAGGVCLCLCGPRLGPISCVSRRQTHRGCKMKDDRVPLRSRGMTVTGGRAPDPPSSPGPFLWSVSLSHRYCSCQTFDEMVRVRVPSVDPARA